MGLIEKKAFLAANLDIENKIFVVHIVFFTNPKLSIKIYLFYKTEIVALYIQKALLIMLNEYIEFTNLFSIKKIVISPKHIRANNYTIKLI